jgi:hypothetical protein
MQRHLIIPTPSLIINTLYMHATINMNIFNVFIFVFLDFMGQKADDRLTPKHMRQLTI